MLTLLSTKILSLKIPIIFNYTNGTHLIRKKKNNATDIHYRDNNDNNFSMYLPRLQKEDHVGAYILKYWLAV